MQHANSRGFRIHYEDVGDGAPVVLLNGYASPAAEWTEVGYTDRLVGRYRVLAVDSLGHGESDKTYDPSDYRFPDVAFDIVAAMDASGVERAALWGYSRGAKLAATVAAEVPDRVAALVLGGFWPPSESTEEQIDPSTEALMRGDWDAYWEIVLRDEAISAEDRRYMQESSDPRAMAAVSLGTMRSDYSIDASRITAPTLLYYGSEDASDPDLGPAIAAFGVPHVLEGRHDHFSAFTDVASVAPVVLGFLESEYTTNQAGTGTS